MQCGLGASLVGHVVLTCQLYMAPTPCPSWLLPHPQANKDEIKARIAQIKKELAETDSGEQFQQNSLA